MTRVMKRQLEEELDLENTIKPSQPTKSEPTKSDFPRKTPGPSVVQESVDTESDEVEPVDVEPIKAEPADDQHDDTYSPAHEADEVGTGVGNKEPNDQETNNIGSRVNNEALVKQEPDDAQPAAIAEPEAPNDTKEKDS